LLQDRPKGDSLRVWNPGCSTGEETYSLAIVLKECLEELKLQGAPAIQIFATDIDNDAIDKARRGTFSAGIAADVSPERLARFSSRKTTGYRIKKEIRDLVVFAPQNLLLDPPFTKLDILCCRNLLIYVNAETQKKLLPLMHYALNPGGLLILGTAESIGGFDHLFSPWTTKWKVFQRREVSERPARNACGLQLPRARLCLNRKGQRTGHGHFLRDPAGAVGFVRPFLGGGHRRRRHHLRQRANRKYLEPSSGKVNNNVFAMAREGLREELGVAIHNAATAEGHRSPRAA
jgi:two-component system, chemotaxis family, CheB/CheR fusion protein